MAIRCVPRTDVRITDSFFRNLMNTAADNIIPYQWEALNDRVPGADPSYCIRNFRTAAGLESQPFGGWVFQDSDLAKWIEACSYMLEWRKDPETEKHIDETVELMRKAQREDGYLDTYYIINGLENRWTNTRDNHELYCAGHMLEAAVAYYKATGKRSLLDIMIRYVDHIASVFGPEEGKLQGYPGHEEIELALVKLYEVTGEKKHLELAKYFIDERGRNGGKFFYDEAVKRGAKQAFENSMFSDSRYFQAGAPVREQKAALGHAVRQCYLLSGMADTARETGDESLKQACRDMWHDITRRQMYITGAVGQSAFGEAFTYDWDLPNDTVYGETCASIAMVFFAHRMLRMELKGEYGDVMDTMLYNGTVSGMNLEGNRFFYVNPLESVPERCRKNHNQSHVAPSRRKWFGCACCPPNLARMICQLPGYVYLSEGDRAYMNLFTTGEADIQLDSGILSLETRTDYPWNGKVTIRVGKAFDGCELAVRKPGWCKKLEVSATYTEQDGFAVISGIKAGDEIVFDMEMPVTCVRANPKVRADAGKIAVRRGPVVYCLEEADNGDNLAAITLDAKAEFTAEYDKNLLGGVVRITAPAKRTAEWKVECLYSDAVPARAVDITAVFVPYFAWNNRGEGEMTVWVRE